MSLDATVYCNCFETGALKEQPPVPNVLVAENGSLEYRSDDLNTLIAFDQWCWHRACEHPSGILLHHRIGNIAQVALLRSELQRDATAFPILLTKVVYNGIHGGDHLTISDIENLAIELERLGRFVCSTKHNQEYVDWFHQQMSELVTAARRVGKPLSF
jgi:hypothetical protein